MKVAESSFQTFSVPASSRENGRNWARVRKPNLQVAVSGRLWFALAVLFSGMVGLLAPHAMADTRLFEDRTAAVPVQQQQLLDLLREKITGHDNAMAERAADEFVARLRAASPIAAENLKQGRMDEDELRSRVEVFLRENPKYANASSGDLKKVSPRDRVAEAFRAYPKVWKSEAERNEQVDKFLARLQEKNRTASESLNAGSMTDEEVQSRVAVYMSDLQGDSMAGAVDPKRAALSGLVDSYLKANYGVPSERAASYLIKGVVEAKEGSREFVIYRKRPDKLRMHVVSDGIVIGVVAYDGKTVWRQDAGRRPRALEGDEAASVVRLSRFDDPLMDYFERGAELRLEDKSPENLVQLHLREVDGSESVFDLDAKTFKELAQRTRQPGKDWVEIRFSDHRKVNAFNLARVQEEWEGGKLKTTTRIKEANTDPGIVDQFFAMPSSDVVGYMDYMAGVAYARAQEKQRAAAQETKKEAVK